MKSNTLSHKFLALIVIMMVLIIYICVAKIDIVSPGTGVITGASDKLVIVSPDSGFINKFDLRTGSPVKIGDILFSYTNLDVFHQEKTLNELVSFAGRRIQNLEEDQQLLKMILAGEIPEESEFSAQIKELFSHELSAYKFLNELFSLRNEEKNLKQREEKMNEEKDDLHERLLLLKRKGNLLKSARAPEIEIINNQTEVSQIVSQITTGDISLLALQNDIKLANNRFRSSVLEQLNNNAEQLEQLRRERLENRGQLELLRNKIKANSVLSPTNGVILSIERSFEKGSYVENAQPVMTIKKNNESKVVDARILAKYRPFIFTGASVKITVTSPGYKKTIAGQITRISADSFSDDEKNGAERYYKIEIKPDDSVKVPPELEGVQVNVYALSKKVTLLNYITALVGDNIVFNVW
ncbi:HlyD family efflux transporter periplasmic adaptor subunit [Salmonella enterica]|uniref:Hemolysin secretion protein D n=1 Tax=Salmonella enterica subsp. enterica serovar Uzaramo TaxID=2565147 RepID=A0A636K5I1_SALET|nr:HlyD family secretion protein [Salmonella enterica]EAW2068556.1 HlyD family efflux transporter periplasmic adaptor subunit [Salmonella enterica subsp. diarizonae]EBU9775501.1 hemolysin secretion protein D [Salmonella enterica subsp. enterica serovar Kumasi]EBW5060576.1 hemolysin secretion protein D [Salmonella enterica subsp. enterica serovar Somone]ECB1043302.1 HlyD family efflux transporter periplasmic adaptor subunit [Salmonella enterica subsp. enterica serovar Aschersleben]ECE6306682.1 